MLLLKLSLSLLLRSLPGLVRCGMLAAALVGVHSTTHGATPGGAFPPDTRLYLSYAAKPDAQAVLAHDLCILDPAADAPLALGRAMGHTHLAYVSMVEVVPGTGPAQSAEKRGIPLMGLNPGWNSAVLDITHTAWETWLIDDVVKPAIEKGYDGVFLDTLDSVMRITSQNPDLAPACHQALIKAIRRIEREFPEKRIVLNRGFRVVEEVAGSIDGVLIESVFQTWSPETKAYGATRAEGMEWLMTHISRIQALKLPVLVVDYVPADDAALARQTAERIRAKGCIPFVTTPDLQGEELAPLREVPRRIAVLHGWKPEQNRPPGHPADTFTFELLHAPLEWLGAEVVYFDVNRTTPADLSLSRYRGLVIDAALKLPVEREEEFADWLLSQHRRGVKLLFAGALPFTRENVIRRVFDALSMAGSSRRVRPSGTSSIIGPGGRKMQASVPASAIGDGYPEVTAPRGAKLMLSLEGRDNRGRAVRSDCAFLASWGGALLLRNLPEQACRTLEVHEFLASWIGAEQPFPAPDVTTRDGMRIFYAHFDGDGFVARSALEGKPICGEAIRDKVLKTFSLPITVSVIEAEIEGHVSGHDPLAVPRHREAARSVFALPNVQGASHTYSHPFHWPDEAGEGGWNLALKPWVNYHGKISVDREVRGSVEYMNRVLMPRDKAVEMLLWSGNGRPGPEPLRLCRELGAECLGGSPASTVRHVPGMTGLPPNAISRDGEIQVLAASKPGSLCASGQAGPFYGSVENVTESFESTESPRRLKPVNAGSHFHAAAYLASLRSLEKMYAWCMEQPLHAITARQYAQIVRDAAATRVYETAPGRWLISNAGQARTFRLPAGMNTPDIAASKGVTGWLRQGDALYIHTRGLPVTELVLGENPKPHLRLAQCSAEIEFRSLSPTKAEFSVTDLRPVQAAFAGAPPRTVCQLLVNGQSLRLESDDQGRLTLNLPATADVTLDFSTARYASQR